VSYAMNAIRKWWQQQFSHGELQQFQNDPLLAKVIVFAARWSPVWISAACIAWLAAQLLSGNNT